MAKPNSKNEDELDPVHAGWLVEHRAATQRTCAKLYGLLKQYPNELGAFFFEVNTLAGVAYSLWRSVFLSDRTSEREVTYENATKFLAEILQNNAIAYSQERNAKNWTFNYYAENARYRLKHFKDARPDAKLGSLEPQIKLTAKRRWEVLQEAFEKAVDFFEERLKAARAAKSPLKTGALSRALKSPLKTPPGALSLGKQLKPTGPSKAA
jgi:hypothetical protein